MIRRPGPPRVVSAFFSDSQQGSCTISKDSPALAAGEQQLEVSTAGGAQGLCLCVWMGIVVQAGFADVEQGCGRSGQTVGWVWERGRTAMQVRAAACSVLAAS